MHQSGHTHFMCKATLCWTTKHATSDLVWIKYKLQGKCLYLTFFPVLHIFFCLFVWSFSSHSRFFTHMESHHYRWRAPNFDLCSAPMAIEQWQVNIKIWQVDIIIWQVMAEICHHNYETWLRILHITLFRCLKRVGIVLSRPDLEPFLHIWHHAVIELRPKQVSPPLPLWNLLYRPSLSTL